MPIVIRQAEAKDLKGIAELLHRIELPVDGVAEHIARFIVAESQGKIRGCAGLEIYGGAGLLRSVAVHPDSQNRGLGSRLLKRILSEAKTYRLKALYLLTTNAGPFMSKFGFQEVARNEVDARIQQSVEFKSACCENAICMKRSV